MTVKKIKITSWDGGETATSLSYRVSALVTTDDPEDGPFTVRQALDIHLYDSYLSGNDNDPRANLKSSKETQVSDGTFTAWFVDIEYGETEYHESPLDEPVQEVVAWDGVPRLANKWADGKPILNTARQPFVDKVEWIDNTPSPTYSLNLANFNFVLAQAARNAINSATWKGFLTHTVKVRTMTSERKYDQRIGKYYAVSFSFEVNPDTWETKLDSMGLSQLEHVDAVDAVPPRDGKRGTPARPAHDRPVPIKIGGVAVTTPQGLDEDGHVISVYDAGGELLPIEDIPAPAVVSGFLYPEFDYEALFPFLI